MRASLEGSNGELCEVDQANPPSCRSIMSLMVAWASPRVFPVARNVLSFHHVFDGFMGFSEGFSCS